MTYPRTLSSDLFVDEPDLINTIVITGSAYNRIPDIDSRSRQATVDLTDIYRTAVDGAVRLTVRSDVLPGAAANDAIVFVHVHTSGANTITFDGRNFAVDLSSAGSAVAILNAAAASPVVVSAAYIGSVVPGRLKAGLYRFRFSGGADAGTVRVMIQCTSNVFVHYGPTPPATNVHGALLRQDRRLQATLPPDYRVYVRGQGTSLRTVTACLWRLAA